MAIHTIGDKVIIGDLTEKQLNAEVEKYFNEEKEKIKQEKIINSNLTDTQKINLIMKKLGLI